MGALVPVRGRPSFLSSHRVQIRFESPESLRSEFDKNIANRGIFIATDQTFAIRQAIKVEVVLCYVDASQVALTLPGEVVHCIPVELVSSGAVPGIAVQFDASAGSLRASFEPLLDVPTARMVEADKEGPARRASKRGSVRVPVRIMPAMSPPFEATSRDLSATGILLTMKESSLPVGEIVRTCLWHPSGESSVEIDGQVVREVRNKSGQIAAVAVAFDRQQVAEPRIREVIDALRQAGHRSRLGGISGSIIDLGLANMLEMFSQSVPQGTLVVERDAEQGWIAFANGQLLAAELGALAGHDALVAMLGWEEGRFQFEASADPKLIESAPRCPFAAAILKAVCAVDERAHVEAGKDDHEVALDGATTFEVDVEQADLSSASLDKTEQAVIELARAGMTLGKLEAIIPESRSTVRLAVEGLVEMGVLFARPKA